MLSLEEELILFKALQNWAKNSPSIPMLGFLYNENPKEPQEIVDEVKEKSPFGIAVLELLEHSLRRDGIESVVQRLESVSEQAEGFD